MKPRIVTEPLTGLRWIANNRWSRFLAWWPLTVAIVMFWLGYAVGRSWYF